MPIVSSLIRLLAVLALRLTITSALDATQIWETNTCQGPGTRSRLFIDNGEKICFGVIPGHLSWVPMTADSKIQLLFTEDGCDDNAPAVHILPGHASSNCANFRTGSGNHILSYSVLSTNPTNVASADIQDAGASSAAVGLGLSVTNVDIEWGSRSYVFGAMRTGLTTSRQVPYTQFQSLRSAFRTRWQSNDVIGAISFDGTYEDGAEMVLVAGFLNTNGIAPFGAYDGFNGQLAPGILERLFWYHVFNGICNVQADILDSIGGRVLFTIEFTASPC